MAVRFNHHDSVFSVRGKRLCEKARRWVSRERSADYYDISRLIVRDLRAFEEAANLGFHPRTSNTAKVIPVCCKYVDDELNEEQLLFQHLFVRGTGSHRSCDLGDTFDKLEEFKDFGTWVDSDQARMRSKRRKSCGFKFRGKIDGETGEKAARQIR
jgi:hypothetical protein